METKTWTIDLNPSSQLNIYQRVLGVMSDIKYIQKGSAKVNGQYSFVSHDKVSASIHPLLVKYGIALIPTVEDMLQEGNRTVAKVAVCFVNVDDPKDCIITRYFGYGVDSGDKGPGKAVSYACKYAMLKTFCLETGDDPDEDAGAVYEPQKCLEFDLQIPADLTQNERAKLNKFLVYSSQVMKKDVEDVKREALGRMPEFMAAFKNWNVSKKKDE